MTELARRSRIRDIGDRDGAARQEASARATDRGAWFLVLAALIPILVLSVGPLLYGVALAFTDAQSGRTEPTRWIGTLNFQDLLHDTLWRPPGSRSTTAARSVWRS